ncbi:hypothetical protein GGTG_10672 [Gaeumannomyces tritici R3-111a-1]|uniref:Uncharacterized protein n=1 Tax=Gaeumannomyces tritici (strain R3-111a-1) TaxID=644352 RepID=J3PAZ8_GAET3|nr:hypothetical protein GGTG_10672 [Gaeumannomyces tritici R3-111a-1]EJT71414.1 hypothetical protein GGTG_10672 [Gaeumannomyces tritici R3-111a-1]
MWSRIKDAAGLQWWTVWDRWGASMAPPGRNVLGAPQSPSVALDTVHVRIEPSKDPSCSAMQIPSQLKASADQPASNAITSLPHDWLGQPLTAASQRPARRTALRAQVGSASHGGGEPGTLHKLWARPVRKLVTRRDLGSAAQTSETKN